MAIFYTVGQGLYVNLTNLCPCKCYFCIREKAKSVGNCDSLWLDHEPTWSEIIADLANFNLDQYNELVFCGYGEPLMRLNEVLKLCDYIKSKSSNSVSNSVPNSIPVPIRINTNGLGNLIHKRNILPELAGKIDEISISLNAPNSNRYQEICNPSFKEEAYPALLKFATEAKKVIPSVVLTVLDLLEPAEIEECRQIAKNLGLSFRIRGYF